MELAKHKHLTDEALERRANLIYACHLEQLGRMEEDGFPDNDDNDGLFRLLVRQRDYGVFGLLSEGEMLIDDFNYMNCFAAIEGVYASFLYEGRKSWHFQDQKTDDLAIIGTIQLAASARHRINLMKGVSMSEFYDLPDDFTDVKDYVSFKELAVLADMSEQSIKNDLSKNKKDYPLHQQSAEQALSVLSAIKWLSKRSAFKNTMEHGDVVEEKMNKDRFYVPVAKDGTFFDYQCRMTKGYQVGAKGETRYFESFEYALKELRTMQKGKWRRPNDKGNFGIVSAVEWRYIDKAIVLGLEK